MCGTNGLDIWVVIFLEVEPLALLVQWKLVNTSSDNTKTLIIQGDFQVPRVSFIC